MFNGPALLPTDPYSGGIYELVYDRAAVCAGRRAPLPSEAIGRRHQLILSDFLENLLLLDGNSPDGNCAKLNIQVSIVKSILE